VKSTPVVIALLLLAAVIGACGGKPDTPVQEYKLIGEVLRVDPVQRIATIRHQKIEGWMEAMTMDFPVRKNEPIEDLHAGRKIEAKVYVQGLTFEIGDLRSNMNSD
jgi:Cu/Ag efflux protein CusF